MGVTVLAAVSVSVLIVALVWTIWLKPAPYDPLGDYPVQKVTTSIPGVLGPATTTDGVVLVTGTKCNNSRSAVTVRGETAWQSIDPRGGMVPLGHAIAHRQAGCETRTFANPVPPEVAEITERLGGKVIWRITGTETPLDRHGHEGVPRTWVTENFTVISEGS